MLAAKASGPIQPIHLHEVLDQDAPFGEVEVTSGSWNIDAKEGSGFGRWTATPSQQLTLERLRRVSQALHKAFQEASLREMGGRRVRPLRKRMIISYALKPAVISIGVMIGWLALIAI
ncbi:MAG: hypothetical protein EBQ73_06495 [Gammaproteobacteria bacterium]|nr:hypothetical protein [Gammaproteobacteria bacterium]